MYNSIQIIFQNKDEQVPPQNLRPNSPLRLIPWPNQINISQERMILQKKCKIYLKNIDKSSFIIEDFISEISEDFLIDPIIINTNLESLPKTIKDQIPSFNPNKLQELEGYSLFIKDSFICLQAASSHGIFNGLQTMRQIFTQTRSTDLYSPFIIPQLQIVDWPAMIIRGVSDDISRGQIPTLENAKRFIRDISRVKNNYYALYIEDVFQCSKHPAIGANRGAFTSDELRELDEYAKRRFITLFPIFETLGHADNILSLDEYRDLGEFPGSQCFSIGNGNIYPLLKDIIEELAPNFSSKIFHIALDESFDLGHGNSKELINAIGMGKALGDHIRKISTIVRNAGSNQIILYHDVIAKYPELMATLPKDLILMYWNYSAKSNFKDLNKIHKNGFPIIVSPSMQCWSRHFPDYRYAAKNIISLIEKAKNIIQKDRTITEKSTILGQLTSTWGDFSNHNFRENNIYGAIIAGAVSWTWKPVKYNEIVQDIGIVWFGLQDRDNIKNFSYFFNGIVDLNRKSPNLRLTRQCNFYDELYRHPFRSISRRHRKHRYSKTFQEISDLLQDWKNISPFIKFNYHYIEYLEFGLEIMKFLKGKQQMTLWVNKLIYPYRKAKIPNEIILQAGLIVQELLSNAKLLLKEYQKLWLGCARNPMMKRPVDRFQQLINFLEDKKIQLKQGIPWIDPFLPSNYIWSHERITDSKPRYFRKKFEIEGRIKEAKLQIIADNYAEIFVNEVMIGSVSSRFSLSILPLMKSVKVFDIAPFLQEGKNIIAIEARHFLQFHGSINVFIELNTIENVDSKPTIIYHSLISDGSWEVYSGDSEETKDWDWTILNSPENSESKKQIKWQSVKVLGKPPAIHGDLYIPHLFLGEKSINEDRFLQKSSIFFIIQLLFNQTLAKIIRFFFI